MARQQAQNHDGEIWLHIKFNFNRLYPQEEKRFFKRFNRPVDKMGKRKDFWTPKVTFLQKKNRGDLG